MPNFISVCEYCHKSKPRNLKKYCSRECRDKAVSEKTTLYHKQHPVSRIAIERAKYYEAHSIDLPDNFTLEELHFIETGSWD